MTEYDSSPEAYDQFKRTQNRIAHWVEDTDNCAPQFKSPFVPRSDVQDNAFYNPRSASSSRSPHRRSSTPPQQHTRARSASHGPPQSTQPHVRSPLRSQTISVVSPQDSISQASGPSHRPAYHSRRSHSHSPTRHTSSHRSRHRSGGYVIIPGGAGAAPVQYAQPAQYAQTVQAQPAAYVVIPRDRKVQIVYATPQPQPAPAAHPSLLQRVFGSPSGHHARSRSLSHSRSSSRSRR
ncbi:hypothetical protein DFH09DRAFT_1186011 [Mycena vulgaris]|nr:hypothetical protein DFH09DRAFT_1186011 [Mycena vulgaris]